MIPALIDLLIYLVVVGIVIGLIWWVADIVPIPEPFNRIIKVVVMVIGVLILILLLLQLAGVARVDLLPPPRV